MNKALIVSDNPKLAATILKIIRGDQLNGLCSFVFKYSASNKSPKLMIDLGFTPINIKDEGVVDGLIGEFNFIFSIHCKQIFPAKLVKNITCINLHPGFNPHNRGWYPQVFSILNKKPIGATLHLMTEDVDGGPIIIQEEVFLSAEDTSLTLYEKVQKVEIDILKKKFRSILIEDILAEKCTSSGNFNSLVKFRDLCKLDINDVGSLGDHINLLRALTHGDFSNAFFLDNSGVKIFVKIQLVKESTLQ